MSSPNGIAHIAVLAAAGIAGCVALGLNVAHSDSVDEEKVVGALLAKGVCTGTKEHYACDPTYIQVRRPDRMTYLKVVGGNWSGIPDGFTWDSTDDPRQPDKTKTGNPEHRFDIARFMPCVQDAELCVYTTTDTKEHPWSKEAASRWPHLNELWTAKFHIWS